MIKKRTRFFLAVEGESELAFAKWLYELSLKSLHVHLDAQVVYGGGFKTMLSEAVRLYKKGIATKGHYQDGFLLVDSDRAEQGDWSVAKLKSEAAKHGLTVCFQRPKHEGVLLRMMPGMENTFLDSLSTEQQLKSHWPTYQKPVNARVLGTRFALDDLLRMAIVDTEIQALLRAIGLM